MGNPIVRGPGGGANRLLSETLKARRPCVWRSVGRRLAIAAATCAALAAAPPAGSEPAERISYAAPSGCPDERRVREDLAGRARKSAGAEAMRIALRIEARPGGFLGRLIVDDPEWGRRERQVDGTTCEEVARALVFLAGLTLEDLSAVPIVAPPPRSTVLDPIPDILPRFAPVLGAGARGGLGEGAAPIGQIGFERESPAPSRWTPFIRLGLVASQAAVGQGADSGLTILLAAARLDTCALALGRGRLRAGPCLAGELGALSLRSASAANGAPAATVFWAAADVGVVVRWWAAGPLFLEIGGGAIFPFNRRSQTLAPALPTFAPPIVAARLVAGAGLQF